MAASEAERHELHRSLEGAIGKKPSATLMTMLERAAREDWATRQDIAELRGATRQDITELRAEFAELRVEFSEFRAEMQKALRGQLLAIITVFTFLNGMLLAAIKVL